VISSWLGEEGRAGARARGGRHTTTIITLHPKSISSPCTGLKLYTKATRRNDPIRIFLEALREGSFVPPRRMDT
jgi:hypothetical protein